MDLDQGIHLCRSARRDLGRMLAALERKSFYDAGHDIGHAAVGGLAFKGMDQELQRLEQLLSVENYRAIREHEWQVSDLVNHDDRLIDLVEGRGLDPEKAPSVIGHLYRWRDTAGKLAQVVCQIEDSEPS